MRLLFVSGLVGLFVVICSTSVGAHGRRSKSEKKPDLSAWLTYWDHERGRQSLVSDAEQLREVDLFAYHFAADDSLVPADANFRQLEEAVHQLPGKRPQMGITLVNDVETGAGIKLKDPACVHRVLSTAAAREAHIGQIMAIAEGADSIDIDYERVAADDSAVFTSFIQALAAALHQKGKRLSVVVEPRLSDGPTSDPLSNGTSALSWADISQSADQLTVMAYLYHYGGSGPGSIAPIDWVTQIAAYGLTKVQPEKLSIALHLGGYDWPKNGPGKSLDYDKATALSSVYGQAIQLDRKTQSGYMTYTNGSGEHEVWIETAEGLRAKIKALAAAGIRHIALWRLGSGDPLFWDKISR